MTPRSAVLMALVAACANPAASDSLLALPSDEGLTVWDTSQNPPIVRFTGLSGGTAGACYTIDQDRLSPDPDPTACLRYLRDDIVASGTERYDINGRVEPLAQPLNDYYRGFVVTGVRGIDYCGERENCDEIYIIGVQSDAALTALSQAALSGTRVRLTGPGVWNLESIDLLVENVSR